MQQPSGNRDNLGAKANLAWYLILFFSQFVVGSVLVFWREIRDKTDDSPLSTIVGIGNGLEWVVVVAGALSYATVEGVDMLAARYREQLWDRGIQKGREEGRKETLDQILHLLDAENRRKVERELGITDNSKK